MRRHRESSKTQKRVLKIIVPSLSYCEALTITNLTTLRERRRKLCEQLLQKNKNSDRLIELYFQVLKLQTITCDHRINIIRTNVKRIDSKRSRILSVGARKLDCISHYPLTVSNEYIATTYVVKTLSSLSARHPANTSVSVSSTS